MKQKKVLFFSLTAVVICVAAVIFFISRGEKSTAADGENLLKNSGFDTLDNDGLPEGWFTDAYLDADGVTVFGSGEGVNEGSSVYIKNNAANDARFVQYVDVKPDSLYRLHGYIKANTAGGMGANLSVEGAYVFSNCLFDTEGEWEEATLYGRTGENQTYLAIYARLGGYSGESIGEAWFDDVTIQEVFSVPEGFLAQDLFSQGGGGGEETPVSETTGAPLLILSCLLYAALLLCLIRFALPERDAPGKALKAETAPRGGLMMALMLLVALIVRLVTAQTVPGYDVDINCFTSWGNRLAAVGPSDFYAPDYFCDYPPGYILILGLCGLIGSVFGTGATELLVKLPPIICDLLGGLILYAFTKKSLTRGEDERKTPVALLLACLYLFNPLPILNGASWGQSDSVVSLFLLLTVISALNGKWRYALPYYMLAVLIKPQALMFGPLGLLALGFWLFSARKDKALLYKRLRDALFGLLGLALVFLAIALPFSVKKGGFGWLFELYGKTLSSYRYASVNACNLYFLFGLNWQAADELIPRVLPGVVGALLLVPALLIYLKKGADMKTRKLALIVAGTGVALAFAGLLIPLSSAVFGQIMIAVSLLIVFSAFWIGGNMKHLPLFGAVLLILIFNTGSMMHERYLFPALILLLLSYALEKDVRVLYLTLGVTISLVLNVGSALDRNVRIGGSGAHLTAPIFGIESDMAALEYISAVLNFLSAGFALYLMLRLTDANAPCAHLKRAKKQRAENGTAPQSFELQDFKSSPLSAHKTDKKDWIILLSVTALYAVLAYTNLGSTLSPQTAYRFSDPEETVIFDLGENYDDFRMLYMGGIHHQDNEFSIAVSEDGITYSEEYACEMKQGSLYQWKYANSYSIGDSRSLSGRYVRLTAQEYGLNLLETIFRDKDGNVLPVLSAVSSLQGDTSPLIDEQNTLSGEPNWYNSMYFDEIYHARTAYEHLHGLTTYEWTHPPLGKVIMSWCVAIFGMTPFGWRFGGATCGVLMLPGMYLLGRLLFKKRRYAVLAMALMALDTMHFTQTRIATIDSYVVLFIIWSVYFMLRWFYSDFFSRKWLKTLVPLGLSGLFMGLAFASKWTGAYAGVGLAVLFFFGIYKRVRATLAAKKVEGEEEIAAAGIKRTLITIASCLIFFIAVPLAIYYVSYIPHFASQGGVSVQGIINVSESMLNYHGTPGLGMDHRFYSPWYEWPLSITPMYYASAQYEPEGYASSIMAFGNPAIWWVGAICLLVLIYAFIRHQAYPVLSGYGYNGHKRFCLAPNGERDLRPALLLICFFAQYLPWLLVPRGTYIYHYFPSVPFVILSVTLVAEYLSEFFAARNIEKGMEKTQAEKRTLWYLTGYIILAGVLFIGFFPYASGVMVRKEWLSAMNWLGFLKKGWLFF